MTKKIRVKKNNHYGFLFIRRTGVDTRAYIEFSNGKSETIIYDRFDSEEYIFEDLALFHGYVIIPSKDNNESAA